MVLDDYIDVLGYVTPSGRRAGIGASGCNEIETQDKRPSRVPDTEPNGDGVVASVIRKYPLLVAQRTVVDMVEKLGIEGARPCALDLAGPNSRACGNAKRNHGP